MTVLSAQTITDLCIGRERRELGMPPMIDPFLPDKVVINGKSAGLSSASYDLRIAHDLVLGPAPGEVLAQVLTEQISSSVGAMMAWIAHGVTKSPPCRALAHTVENFAMPIDVCAQVLDKSSYARHFITCLNTWIDPGWCGNLTLELVNLGPKEVILRKGDPICQVAFWALDKNTERPYANGKYSNQQARPTGARYEHADGTFSEDPTYSKATG